MSVRTTRPNDFSRPPDAGLTRLDLELTLEPDADLPAVNLAQAARLLLLLSHERSPLYRRAATRWLSRYAAETRDLTPAMLADAACALEQLERGDLEAAERLRAAAGSPSLT